MLINGRFDVDAEIAAARARVERAIARVIHREARSLGQRKRRARERASK